MAIENDYGTGYPMFPAAGGLYAPPTADTIARRTAAAQALSRPASYGPDRFGDESQAASYPAPSRAPNTSYAVDQDNAREMKGMQNGTRGGGYVSPGTQAAQTAAQNTYGANDNFSFRTRIAQGGAPGETLTKDYGLGGPNVLATADARGRFNSFSQAPGQSAAPTMSPFDAQIAALQQRAAYYHGQGTLTGRIFAANANKQINILRNQQVAAGHLGVAQRQLGVQQGHLDLMQQQANPEIAFRNAQNALIAGGPNNLTTLQRITAARAGEPNTKALPGVTGTSVVDAATPNVFYPSLPNAQGQLPAPTYLEPLRKLSPGY